MQAPLLFFITVPGRGSSSLIAIVYIRNSRRMINDRDDAIAALSLSHQDASGTRFGANWSKMVATGT